VIKTWNKVLKSRFKFYQITKHLKLLCEETMRRYIGLIAFTLLGFLWGCQSIQVNQDYDMSKDFSSLKTYEWQTKTQPETGDIRVDNSLLDARIRSAINDSLSKRGYQRITQGKPDFYVAYKYQIRRKIGSDDVRMGVGFGLGSRGSFGGVGVSSGRDISEYDEGVLVIDLKDASSGDLMWRGTGTAVVKQQSKPEEITKGVNEAVEKILSQFPPLPK
jgi:hypothetical protein